VDIVPNIQPFDLEENRQRELASRLAAQQAGVTSGDAAVDLHTASGKETKNEESGVKASASVSVSSPDNDVKCTVTNSEDAKEEVYDSKFALLEEWTKSAVDHPIPQFTSHF